MIYFITVNYHCAPLISRLIASIQASSTTNIQIVIVNNSLDDVEIFQLKGDRVRIINASSNIGFGRACNLALDWVYEQSPKAIAWIINPDAYLLEPDEVGKLVALLQAHPEVSLLGTVVCEPELQVCFTGGTFIPQTGFIVENKLPFAAEAQVISKEEKIESSPIESVEPLPPYRHTDWVTGCSLVLNLQQFEQCPYFDPDYFLYYEDFDFCRRYGKQGHVICITDHIKVMHQTSAITSRNPSFKLKHEIYSYLISLEKHAAPSALCFRLIRIFVVAIWQLFFQPQMAYGKLQGLKMYSDRGFRLKVNQIFPSAKVNSPR